MLRHFVVSIVLLIALISIAGCGPAEPERAAGQPVEVPKADVPAPEPNDIEPVKPEPVQVELPTPEPNDYESAKPEAAEASKPEPEESESTKPEAAVAPVPEPNESESVKTEPPEPSIAEPNELESVEAERTEDPVPEPNEVEPVKTGPPEDEVPVAEANDLESVQVKSEPAEPNELETAAIEPNGVEPNEAEVPAKVSFHDKCAEIFKEFVDEDGMVNYRRLKAKRSGLQELLREFDRLDSDEYKSWPKDDKIAFWINAYNIKLLHIIVRNYPIKSSPFLRLTWDPTDIRHIPPAGKLGAGKWDAYKFMVMDQEFTLGAIEERFFRKELADPRIFLALSYASLSGPPLRNEPYYGYKLDEQLDDQTKRFLSSPRGFKIDRQRQKVYLWALFQPTWHGKEFVSKFSTDKKFKNQPSATRAVLNFISNYVSERDASFLEVGNYEVANIRYDWRLNDNRSR